MDIRENLRFTKKFLFFKLDELVRFLRYFLAKKIYSFNGGKQKQFFQNPTEIGVNILLCGAVNSGGTIFQIDREITEILNSIYAISKEKLLDPKECLFRSFDDQITKKINTQAHEYKNNNDLEEIKNRQVQNIMLKDITNIPELQRLCNKILPQVEKKFMVLILRLRERQCTEIWNA